MIRARVNKIRAMRPRMRSESRAEAKSRIHGLDVVEICFPCCPRGGFPSVGPEEVNHPWLGLGTGD